MFYAFGDFSFDTAARELVRLGQVVHLPPKAFAMLQALLEARPRALAKEELHEQIWPGVHVTDASLARVASELRQALGETAGQVTFIRTVHGFGYCFEGEVGTERLSLEEPWHLLLWKQGRVFLRSGNNILGRDPQSVVAIDAAEVSRYHCQISVRGEVAVLEDLGSKNGTLRQGEKISSPVELKVGDVIELGPVTLIYGDLSQGSTVTALGDSSHG